jgi:tRNA pseudouridine38-40 synthase
VHRNICLQVAYDGTDFHGWQTQPGQRTLQGLLEEVIQRTVRHPIELIGSGRTDAGVHAAGQVCNFRTSCELACDRLRHSLGSHLAEDVAICHVCEVRPEFHATRSAESKLYQYRIYNTPHRPVERFVQRYVHHFWHPLNAGQMREAAAHFVGEMDFTSMAATGGEPESMVRTVLRCEIERHVDEIRIDVEGTGFLYKQVRNMVGTLLQVGRGIWPPEKVAEILAARDRSKGGPTAPARGLCLRWVRYPHYMFRSSNSNPTLGGNSTPAPSQNA